MTVFEPKTSGVLLQEHHQYQRTYITRNGLVFNCLAGVYFMSIVATVSTCEPFYILCFLVYKGWWFTLPCESNVTCQRRLRFFCNFCSNWLWSNPL